MQKDVLEWSMENRQINFQKNCICGLRISELKHISESWNYYRIFCSEIQVD